MKAIKIAALIVIILLIIAMAVMAQWPRDSRQTATTSAPAEGKAPGNTSAASPTEEKVSPISAPGSTPKVAVSSLHREFSNAKDYFVLFKALEGRTDPEALFYKASILDRCRQWSGKSKKETPEERIQKFNANLTGPYKDIRKAINAKLQSEAPISRCVNFTTPVSEADVDAAYDAAAKAGDIRGQLDQLHRSLLASATRTSMPAKGVPGVQDAKVEMVLPAGPTDAEVALLKQALASKDPVQIAAAGPLLSAQYSNYELKFGDGKGLFGIPDHLLWNSVACHYAGGCGSESIAMQRVCALTGRCEVSSYDEYLRLDTIKEADWQNFLRYRATLIEAIDTQNWALLQEQRGPRSNIWGTQISPGNRSPRFFLWYY
jgi:hypothetical protein